MPFNLHFYMQNKVHVLLSLNSFNKEAWEILKCILVDFLCLPALLSSALQFFFENLRGLREF